MSWLLPGFLTETRCLKAGWLVLLVFAAILYLPGLGDLPMMDRDEPRFAHATVEMMQRGSWSVPYFNGEYRFDKPPLTYWWMALHYRLLGVGEFAARLHAVLSAWLVALVVSSIGRRWFDARAGLLAGLAWLATTQVLVHGRLCVADMPMVLCVALAMRCIMEILFEGDELRPTEDVTCWSRWHSLLYVALGLGFLAKGPIAWLVPALALVLFRFGFWRKPLPWARLYLDRGLLLALAIVAVWGVPALIETKGLFWKVGMGQHVVERGASALNGRFPVPGYYLATALLSLFPWIALLPQIWRSARRRWNPVLALLVSWFLAPYLIFTFYATQLPHYVMPGFPAAMLLLAAADARMVPSRFQRWWAAAVCTIWLTLGFELLWISHAWSWPDGLKQIVSSGAWFVCGLGLFGVFITWAALKCSRAASICALLLLLCVPAAMRSLCLSLRSVHAGAALAAEAGSLPKETEFIACGFTEPSLVFHFDREWKFTTKPATLDQRLAHSGARYAVVLRREWTLSDCFKRLLARQSCDSPTVDLSREVDALVAAHSDYVVSRQMVFNGARSGWAELVALRRATPGSHRETSSFQGNQNP